MKRIIAILLVLCMVLCLAACGGSEPTNTDNSGNTDNVQQNGDSGNTENNNGTNSSGASDSTNGSGNSNGSGNGGTTANTDKGNTTTTNKEITPFDTGHVVICLGDSITEGMGMATEHRYPSVLGKHLEGQIQVLNAGVGGENTHTIMSRINAIDFTVSQNIVFGKGEKEIAYDWKIFSGMNGEEIKYRYGVMGRDLPITKLTIDGAAYTLRFERSADKVEEKGKYILCREDASEKVKISVGAKVKFNYSSRYTTNYCTVLLMGANGGWNNDIKVLIDGYKKVAAQSQNFIAIVPHYGTDYTKEFEAAFGNKCVNLRAYANGSLYEDYKLEKTQVDKIDLADGKLPRTFNYERRKDDCHLNEQGYKILGDLVYKKGVELGYWK